MSTRREKITGLRFDQPEVISDFSVESKYALIRDLNAAADTMTHLAQLLILQFSLPTTLKFTSVNPNLFILAAQYYGDMRKWNLIGDRSGIGTPVLQGDYDLSVPRVGTGG